MLRGLMDAYPGPHDERWEQRYRDIPRCVRGAEEKFKPRAELVAIHQVDPSTGEILPTRPAEPLFSAVGDLLDNIKPIEWLVEDYLEQNALSMVFGPSGVGKSFVTIDLACCVATGTPWHGKPVKQGPVFYVAGEGHNGLSRRMKAWSKAHGVSLKGVALFKSRKAVQILDLKSVLELIEEIEELVKQGMPRPSLIVIDTLARNFGDGDENTQKDAGRFVQHLDDYMRHRWEAHVMTVHHSGHEMERARGSSALKGAMDQEIWVKGQMGHIEIQVTKMKDAEVPANRLFKIEQIGLDVFDDCGVEITGAYIKPDGNPLEFKVGATRAGQDIMATDVVKAMWPQWPGVPPMAAILGCSERTLSRIMTQLKSSGLAAQKTKTGPWELTEKGLSELELTGYCAVQKANNAIGN
jgi:hypothetical protein